MVEKRKIPCLCHESKSSCPEFSLVTKLTKQKQENGVNVEGPMN
jgi:hypothetical protein